MSNDDLRIKFLQQARSLLGARWRHRGRKPWAVDCVGLVDLSMLAAGRKITVPLKYGREPWDDLLRKGLKNHCGDPVPKPWIPGDIALVRWGKSEPSHMAIIGDHPDSGLSLIHAHSLYGVVEHALSGPFLDCIVEVYRPWAR